VTDSQLANLLTERRKANPCCGSGLREQAGFGHPQQGINLQAPQLPLLV